jgi:protoglobin
MRCGDPWGVRGPRRGIGGRPRRRKTRHLIPTAAPAAAAWLRRLKALGFVADGLTNTILNLGLERGQEVRTLRAFNKLLWLQNDLINRHYQEAATPVAVA